MAHRRIRRFDSIQSPTLTTKKKKNKKPIRNLHICGTMASIDSIIPNKLWFIFNLSHTSSYQPKLSDVWHLFISLSRHLVNQKTEMFFFFAQWQRIRMPIYTLAGYLKIFGFRLHFRIHPNKFYWKIEYENEWKRKKNSRIIRNQIHSRTVQDERRNSRKTRKNCFEQG